MFNAFDMNDENDIVPTKCTIFFLNNNLFVILKKNEILSMLDRLAEIFWGKRVPQSKNRPY